MKQISFNGHNGVFFSVTDVSNVKPELQEELHARFRTCGFVDEDILWEHEGYPENKELFPEEGIFLEWADLPKFISNLRETADKLEKYVSKENSLISVEVD